MIKPLPSGVAPIIDAAALDQPHVQRYLEALDENAPGLDLTWDRAIAVGVLAANETRAGRLAEHLDLAAQTFDRDEFATLTFAAITVLLPGPIPPTVIESLLGVPAH